MHRNHLIPVNTDQGRRLLAEVTTVDYVPLHQYFEGQIQARFCSVASSVITLNALMGQHCNDQKSFFTPFVAKIRPEDQVSASGMTLSELGKVLKAEGVRAKVYYAQSLHLDRFRQMAINNLRRNGNFVIVNFLREKIGEKSGGHFSPLAAHHEATDRFLILDVANYKYPPVWVEAAVLHAAMRAVDNASGRSRGHITLSL